MISEARLYAQLLVAQVAVRQAQRALQVQPDTCLGC